MRTQRLLFIDFEFTMPEEKGIPKGFFPEIIEMGAVVVEENTIIEQCSAYVKPVHTPVLTERCKEFLGIGQEQVEEGMSFASLVELLYRVSDKGNATIIAWGNADEKVLRQNCEFHGYPYPFLKTVVDLSMDYKRFFGDQNQTGLHKAVESYGKKGVGNHHRALDDALTTFEIYKLVESDKGYMKKSEMPTLGERIDWSKLRKMTM